MIKQYFLHYITSFIIATFPTIALAEKFSGIVYDPGVADTNSNGIPGVTVSVRDINDNELASEITDGNGKYEIEINKKLKSKSPLNAYYQKIGYFAYPWVKFSISLSSKQDPVPLARGYASLEYYEKVASYLANSKNQPQPELSSIIASIASLPKKNKEEVEHSLAKENLPKWITDEFAVADKTYNLTEQYFESLYSGNDNSFDNVKVYANFPTAGTMFIYGSVPSANKKSWIEEHVKSIKGAESVESGIFVIYTKSKDKEKKPQM